MNCVISLRYLEISNILHQLPVDTEICQDHWNVQSAAAGNPDITGILCSTSKVSYSVLKETLCCFAKVKSALDTLHGNTCFVKVNFS